MKTDNEGKMTKIRSKMHAYPGIGRAVQRKQGKVGDKLSKQNKTKKGKRSLDKEAETLVLISDLPF